MSYIFNKALVFSIIYDDCGINDEKILKEVEQR